MKGLTRLVQDLTFRERPKGEKFYNNVLRESNRICLESDGKIGGD